MNDPALIPAKVDILLKRGVVVPCPASVELDDALDPDRIAAGVVIHAGSRLCGKLTSIGPGCEIGSEAPATLENCQLGSRVQLKGGYFSGATFLDGANMGSAAHVRPGTNVPLSPALDQTCVFDRATLTAPPRMPDARAWNRIR